MKHLLSVSLLVLALCSCASSQLRIELGELEPLRIDEAFGTRPEMISPADIHTLSLAQEKEFLQYFNQDSLVNFPKHERVFKYLERITSGFNYQDETYTATEALRLAKGNCLSLAIVTRALADVVGVETGYQLVDSTPVYQLDKDVVIKGKHIRSLLYRGSKTDRGATPLRVDYFPDTSQGYLARLTDDEYIASYYRNLAADAIKRHEWEQGYWLLVKSLELDPINSDAYNSLAVLYRRTGRERMAEQVYLFGLEKLPDKLSLLKNYQLLLTAQDRTEEAAALTLSIVEFYDPSPFNWFKSATVAYKRGNFEEAIGAYERAVIIAPYLHEARLGLAKSYYQMGRTVEAEQQLKAALENTAVPETKWLYRAKLNALSQEAL